MAPARCRNGVATKLDSTGNSIWARANYYLETESEDGFSTLDGGYMQIGYRQVSGNSRVIIAKMDANGQLQYAQEHDNIGDVWSISASEAPDSTVFIAFTYYYTATPTVIWGHKVVRLDAQGNVLWGKVYSNVSPWSYLSFTTNDIQALHDTAFVLAGRKQHQTSGQEGYLMRCNANGDTLWTKVFPGLDNIHTVDQLASGDLMVAGVDVV